MWNVVVGMETTLYRQGIPGVYAAITSEKFCYLSRKNFSSAITSFLLQVVFSPGFNFFTHYCKFGRCVFSQLKCLWYISWILIHNQVLLYTIIPEDHYSWSSHLLISICHHTKNTTILYHNCALNLHLSQICLSLLLHHLTWAVCKSCTFFRTF